MQHAATSTQAASWRIALPGTCALFAGIGLARFAYGPLIPALVEEGWATAAEAGYLGAGNLAGYVVGAAAAPWLRRPVAALRLSMLVVAVGLAASAFDLGHAWLLLWRVLLGIAGGVAMGLAGPLILAATPSERRGAVGGLLYLGVGIGLVLSGVVLPPLLLAGLPAAWIGIGLLAAAAAAAGWNGWPATAPQPPQGLSRPSVALVGFALAYACYGAAQVPHALFLVDHVVRGLDRSLGEGAVFWVILGIGAMIGPPLGGRIADRIGFGPALLGGYLVMALAAVLPALTAARPLLAVSALIMGACMPGIAGLAGGRLLELVGIDEQRRWWPPLVVCFALCQAAGGYAFTWLASVTGGYEAGFVTAGGLALLSAALAAWRPTSRSTANLRRPNTSRRSSGGFDSST